MGQQQQLHAMQPPLHASKQRHIPGDPMQQTQACSLAAAVSSELAVEEVLVALEDAAQEALFAATHAARQHYIQNMELLHVLTMSGLGSTALS